MVTALSSYFATGRGFLLADGPGVGKGRQLSAMMHEYNIASKNVVRIIFLTSSRSLEMSIKDDLDSVAGNCLPVLQLSRDTDGGPIQLDDGILFSTYRFFSSHTNSVDRINQIVEWVGDKKAMLVLDECHFVQNAEASNSGVSIKNLKNRLKHAFVVYSRQVFCWCMSSINL